MSHALPRFHRQQQAAQDADKIRRILADTGTAETVTTVVRATLAGDERRLRGIPVVARGVPGMATESAELLSRIR